MNISSCVRNPPVSGHASQSPSLAPGLESHTALLPVHNSLWCGPPMHRLCASAHGPPMVTNSKIVPPGGDVERRFTFWILGSLPLSEWPQEVNVRSGSCAEPATPIGVA